MLLSYFFYLNEQAKEVETETFDGAGAGATAGLILKRKPTNKSGYYEQR